MIALNIAIIIFIILESLNVLILYNAPKSKMGNAVGVFNQVHEIEDDKPEGILLKYFVNWVAGVKLIFICLLTLILFFGSEYIKLLSCFVMILSIATYFWKLHPSIKKLDDMGMITPIGYSKTLFKMIVGMVCLFIIAIVAYFIIIFSSGAVGVSFTIV